MYALAEFGIGRSTAYRLLDLAAVAEAIETTVQHGLGVSHAWDSTGLILPVRAVVDLKGRVSELTDLIAERLTDAHQEAGGAALPAETVGGIVAEARTFGTDPARAVEELVRGLLGQLAHWKAAIGELGRELTAAAQERPLPEQAADAGRARRHRRRDAGTSAPTRPALRVRVSAGSAAVAAWSTLLRTG
ncbi:hypothetical protein ADK60_29895 [Streptomyces sp. XY431]|uniref:hypothetical protein n=1 Tax=Streptomyces sp. XY431 TaxID=1415562 RepID=UPI0006ADA1B9|nr:hypothetical protein [Streptomyces sp. XY431]KOV13310.1 hypothetical protein ADK60_29895 [Streptomyces sp. XY431]